MTPDEKYDVEAALTTLADRQGYYLLNRCYYNGRHRLAFASEKFRQTFGWLFVALADNLCAPIVDAQADRLQIAGWDADEATLARIDELALRSQLPRIQGEAHKEAARSGDAYLLVWPGRDERARIYAEAAHTMTVVFDPEDPTVVRVAVKVWPDRGHMRVNAYFPDRIERWVTTNKRKDIPKTLRGLAAVEDDDGAWVDNPHGVVPVFHLPNNADLGHLGRSELDPVIPLQDALNKSIADMIVAGEFVALPLRAALNAQVRRNPVTGEPIRPNAGPGDMLVLHSDNDKHAASLLQLAGADLRGFLEIQEAYRMEMGRVSKTPAHTLGLGTDGQLSGESRKVIERPFSDKIADRQIEVKGPWEEAIRLGLAMDGLDGAQLSVRFQSATATTEEEKLDMAERKRRLGVPRRVVLRELGYTEDQITEMLIESDAEADAAAERAAVAFDRGMVA